MPPKAAATNAEGHTHETRGVTPYGLGGPVWLAGLSQNSCSKIGELAVRPLASIKRKIAPFLR